MAFNTGNPVGSRSPKDLLDNSENLDELVNSPTKTEQDDRLGVPRKTWRGIEVDFQNFMDVTAYQPLGDYDADGPFTVEYRSQVFLKDGEYYRAAAGTDLPYTTTNWAADEDNFVAVGDAVLRQDLSAPGGSVNVRGCASLAQLKAVIPTSSGQTCEINGTGRAGVFEWMLGDFTSQVGADTGEGIYVKADGIDVTTGVWVRAIGISAMVSPKLDVRWFGVTLDGSTDDSQSWQAAINFASWLTWGAAISMPSGVSRAAGLLLKGGVSLLGSGREKSIIKAPDGWSESSVIETEDFDSDYSSGGNGSVYNPSLKELTIDGNFESFAGTPAMDSGAGVRLYGLRPEIENVRVQACPAIGLHTALSAQTRNSDLWFREDTKLGYIKGLRVFGCAYDGWVFEGPSDVWIDDVEAGVNGWKDPTQDIDDIPYDAGYESLFQPGKRVNNIWFWTTADMGFVHSFGCRQGRAITFGNGSTQTRIKASLIIAESSDEGGLISAATRVQIAVADVHNCYGESGQPYWKDESDLQTRVDNLEIVNTVNANGQTLVYLDGSKSDYGLKIEGNGNAGHGVEIVGNNITVEGDLRGLSGTTVDAEDSTGVMVRSAASQWSAKVRVNASDVVSEVEAGAVGAFDTCIIDNFGNTTGFVGYSSLSSDERAGITLVEEGTPRKSNRVTGVSGTLTAASTALQTVDIPINALWKPNMEEVSVSPIYESGAVPEFSRGPIIYEGASSATNIRVGYELAATSSAEFKFGVKVQ